MSKKVLLKIELEVEITHKDAVAIYEELTQFRKQEKVDEIKQEMKEYVFDSLMDEGDGEITLLDVKTLIVDEEELKRKEEMLESLLKEFSRVLKEELEEIEEKEGNENE